MEPRAQDHWVFAYGSNLNLSDLRRWLTANQYNPAGILALHPAILRHYQLVWDYQSPVRQGGAANVTPSPDAWVYGGLLQIDQATLHALDQKEGHPKRYSRGSQEQLCELTETKKGIKAWVYEVQAEYKQSSFTPPRQHYRDLVATGAAELGLPESWVSMLQATPTLD